MQTRQPKILCDVNGINYTFNGERFKGEFRSRCALAKKENKDVTELSFRTELADFIGLSAEAIKKWLQDKSGPCDFQIVEKIADYWGFEPEILLREYTQMNTIINTTVSTEIQKDVAKHLYRVIAEYIEEKEKESCSYIRRIKNADKPYQIPSSSFIASGCELVAEIVPDEEYNLDDYETVSAADSSYSNVRVEIKSAAFDLPQEAIDALMSLVNHIEWNRVTQMFGIPDTECVPTLEVWNATNDIEMFEVYIQITNYYAECYEKIDSILQPYFYKG